MVLVTRAEDDGVDLGGGAVLEVTLLAVGLNASQKRDGREVIRPVKPHGRGPVRTGDGLHPVLVALAGDILSGVAT